MSLCSSCGAPLPVPTDPTVLEVACHYCGTKQQVGDVEARVRAQIELEREHERARLEAAEQTDRIRERRAERRSWGLFRIMMTMLALIGPAIGLWAAFGASRVNVASIVGQAAGSLDALGEVRVATHEAELRAAKCTTLSARTTTHVDNTAFRQHIAPESKHCVHVLVSGASKASLHLSLDDAQGHALSSAEGGDLHLRYCGANASSYEVRSTAGDTRVAHVALSCPPSVP